MARFKTEQREDLLTGEIDTYLTEVTADNKEETVIIPKGVKYVDALFQGECRKIVFPSTLEKLDFKKDIKVSSKSFYCRIFDFAKKSKVSLFDAEAANRFTKVLRRGGLSPVYINTRNLCLFIYGVHSYYGGEYGSLEILWNKAQTLYSRWNRRVFIDHTNPYGRLILEDFFDNLTPSDLCDLIAPTGYINKESRKLTVEKFIEITNAIGRYEHQIALMNLLNKNKSGADLTL